MDSEKFVYWLQGFVELTDSDTISEKQWLVIKDHLKLVFDKKTPDRSEFKNPNYDEILKALRPKPVDLIGEKYDPTFWTINPPVITC